MKNKMKKAFALLAAASILTLSLAGCGGSQYGDYTTEAAVTKMMWALAQENTDDLLSRNLCGEVRV